MTIIVWDGKTLAADSRSTRSDGINFDITNKIHKLSHLNIKFTDDEDDENSLRIAAIAYSGNRARYEEYHARLIEQFTPGSKKYHSYNAVTFVAYQTMINDLHSVYRDISIGVVVGTPVGYTSFIKMDHGGAKRHKNVNYTILGSGNSSVGQILAGCPGLTSEQVVALAIAHGNGCGGETKVYNPTSDRITSHRGLSKAKKRKLLKTINTYLDKLL